MRKFSLSILTDGVWSKVIALTSILFFVLLADAILSDWVPNYIQTVTGSALIMGAIMSFSSVIGFGADIIFPQLLKWTTVKKLLVMAVLSGVLFSGVLYFSTLWPVLVIFLVAMAVWGVYYELLGFANQQFVSETVPGKMRASVWAVIGIFRNLAYFIGPIIGGVLAVQGDRVVVLTAGGISILAYGLVFFLKLSNKQVVVKNEEINLVKELSHWWVLIEHVWPMLIASFILGLIDATFWTTGTVLTEVLARENWIGGLFLPMYMLPSLFVGILVLKWGIYRGKKKWAEIFMLLGGIALALLFIQDSIVYKLAIVFVSSIFFSVSYPLIDAVYSDIVSRMGRERKHLIGLSASMISLSYIVGPVLAGWIASQVGESMTFVVMGVAMAAVSIMLLILTPRKLRLPQVEIASWE